MLLLVVEDIVNGVAHLRRRLQDVRVITVGEDGPVAAPRPAGARRARQDEIPAASSDDPS
jgi:hypothetical protein